MSTSNKSWTKHYKKLYEFQDKVLAIIKNLNTDFYLTGGTALSRFHLGHRYSDDLDFVTHQDPYFGDAIQKITDSLADNHLKSEPYGISSTFAALKVSEINGDPAMKLHVDFINEKTWNHFGDYHTSEKFSKVDNLRNILSNKISIIPRQEPKDIADIWCICKRFDFNWGEVINEAGQKKLVEELYVVEYLRTFQHERLEGVKWTEPFRAKAFKPEFNTIIEDIITKSKNRLFAGTGTIGGG